MTPRTTTVLFAAVAALLAPAAAHAACPTPAVVVSGGSAPFSASPSKPTTYDLRSRHVRTKSDNGVSINSPPPGTCILNANVVGTQSRTLPWDIVEHGYPYDGVHWSHGQPGAPVSVLHASVVNFVDAIGPPKGLDTAPGGSAFDVEDIYGEWVRDDFLENDACMPGTIRNVKLVSGHTFLSERNSSGPCRVKGLVTISNVNAHLVCMPQGNKHSPGCPAGQAVGSIFKWAPGSGCVNMSDSTFTLDAAPASGVGEMAFPCGVYRNVTIVWNGPGPYPAKVPPGVTVH